MAFSIFADEAKRKMPSRGSSRLQFSLSRDVHIHVYILQRRYNRDIHAHVIYIRRVACSSGSRFNNAGMCVYDRASKYID